MSGTSLLGYDKQFAAHLATIQLASLTLNTTALFYPVMVPVGFGRIRIAKVNWVASASLVQAGGTSTVLVQTGLPGALVTAVAASTVLGGVADTPAEFTLATETAAKELTVPESGIIKVSLAVSNNALGTNGTLGINVYWHSVPRESAGDDIKHQNFYLNL